MPIVVFVGNFNYQNTVRCIELIWYLTNPTDLQIYFPFPDSTFIIQYGYIPYYTSYAVLVPEQESGVFFTTNAYDHLTGLQIVLRALAVINDQPPLHTQQQTCALVRDDIILYPEVPQDVKDQPEGRDAAEYVGTYANNLYGEAVVSVTDNTLFMKYGKLNGKYQLYEQAKDDMIAVGTTIEIRILGNLEVEFEFSTETPILVLHNEIRFVKLTTNSATFPISNWSVFCIFSFITCLNMFF